MVLENVKPVTFISMQRKWQTEQSFLHVKFITFIYSTVLCKEWVKCLQGNYLYMQLLNADYIFQNGL